MEINGMKVKLGFLLIGAFFMVASAQAIEIKSHLNGGLEYHFVNGDTDDCPGIYGNWEIELPQPISLVFGANYFSGDYDLKDYSGSYDSLGLEVLLRIRWEMDQWRPYIGMGGAEYINDFKNIDFPNKLGMIVEGGTYLQLTDTIKIDMSLRYITLQPDHLDPEIGEIIMDAFVIRAGISFAL